jgi:predicted methyltransferase
VDFGICFNVLDHTNDAQNWFDLFFKSIKPGGHFLLQVNTVKDGFSRTEEHNRMHPSPLKSDQIQEMLSAVTDNFDYELSSKPSADNEFFYMAWGQKSLK